MKSIKHSLLKGLGGLLCASSVFAAQAQIIPAPPEVNAKGHFLVDFTTGKVIAEGEADTKLAPASLTKMMTSYVIGTEINAGNISPSDMVSVM